MELYIVFSFLLGIAVLAGFACFWAQVPREKGE
jgi:hypothetical protein